MYLNDVSNQMFTQALKTMKSEIYIDDSTESVECTVSQINGNSDELKSMDIDYAKDVKEIIISNSTLKMNDVITLNATPYIIKGTNMITNELYRYVVQSMTIDHLSSVRK